jgi:hypothetical protein
VLGKFHIPSGDEPVSHRREQLEDRVLHLIEALLIGVRPILLVFGLQS